MAIANKMYYSDNAKNDLILVHRACHGEQKAYAELMQRYKDSIYFMVLKMVNNRQDAMDLMVETFGKAFENLEKYRHDFAFSTWLFRIATNSCIDFIRKKKLAISSIDHIVNEEEGAQPLQIRSDELNPEEVSIKKQQSQELKIIIDRLPPRYSKLINLRYFEGLSYNEIATELKLPIGTIKVQLFRARDLLMHILNRRKKVSKNDI